MDVKDKQEAVIIFFLLEGCTREEIVTRLRNVYGSAACCHVSAFRWAKKFAVAMKTLQRRTPRKFYQYETNAVIRSILEENPNASLRDIADVLSI
jgi:Mn-dependent DtxR family transcriptional regulator